MRAVVITHPGGPEVLRLEEVPDPVPGPGEVLVEVAAAGLNRADVMQRQGHYPPPPGAPPVPGDGMLGADRGLGPDVTGWQVGDEVCALLAGGAYAEKVAVPAGPVDACPGGSDAGGRRGPARGDVHVQGTVYQMAQLSAGRDVSWCTAGPAGSAASRSSSPRPTGRAVACTAGTPEKLARCRELGADLAISYREQDFTAAVLDFTGGHGADVILDIMGAPYLARNLAALAIWGRLVIIVHPGRHPRRDRPGHADDAKRGSIVAATLRAGPPEEKAEVVAATRQHVWPLIAPGEVAPVIAPGAADGRGGAGPPAARRRARTSGRSCWSTDQPGGGRLRPRGQGCDAPLAHALREGARLGP